MPENIDNNAICIKHVVGNDETGRTNSALMLQSVSHVSERFSDVYVFHDARNMQSANEKYAIRFGKAFSELKSAKAAVHHVAVIPKAVPRTMARVAATFGRIHMDVYKDAERLRNHIAIANPQLVESFDRLCKA